MAITKQTKFGIISLIFSFIPILVLAASVTDIFNLETIVGVDIAGLLIIHSFWISIMFGIIGLFQKKGKPIYSIIGLVISGFLLISISITLIWVSAQHFS